MNFNQVLHERPRQMGHTQSFESQLLQLEDLEFLETQVLPNQRAPLGNNVGLGMDLGSTIQQDLESPCGRQPRRTQSTDSVDQHFAKSLAKFRRDSESSTPGSTESPRSHANSRAAPYPTNHMRRTNSLPLALNEQMERLDSALGEALRMNQLDGWQQQQQQQSMPMQFTGGLRQQHLMQLQQQEGITEKPLKDRNLPSSFFSPHTRARAKSTPDLTDVDIQNLKELIDVVGGISHQQNPPTTQQNSLFPVAEDDEFYDQKGGLNPNARGRGLRKHSLQNFNLNLDLLKFDLDQPFSDEFPQPPAAGWKPNLLTNLQSNVDYVPIEVDEDIIRLSQATMAARQRNRQQRRESRDFTNMDLDTIALERRGSAGSFGASTAFRFIGPSDNGQPLKQQPIQDGGLGVFDLSPIMVANPRNQNINQGNQNINHGTPHVNQNSNQNINQISSQFAAKQPDDKAFSLPDLDLDLGPSLQATGAMSPPRSKFFLDQQVRLESEGKNGEIGNQRWGFQA